MDSLKQSALYNLLFKLVCPDLVSHTASSINLQHYFNMYRNSIWYEKRWDVHGVSIYYKRHYSINDGEGTQIWKINHDVCKKYLIIKGRNEVIYD